MDTKPTIEVREEKYLLGLLWCRTCKQWQSLNLYTNNIVTIRKKNFSIQCKPCQRQADKRYKNDPKFTYGIYKRSVQRSRFVRRHGNLEFALTFKQFMMFWQQSCHYCGDNIKTVGIDRIDSDVGYVIDNCVSCCSTCNYMKRNLSQPDFLEQCKKIIEHYYGN